MRCVQRQDEGEGSCGHRVGDGVQEDHVYGGSTLVLLHS